MTENISWADFVKVDMRVGTIAQVEDFPQAKNPAYQVFVDFGFELGIKKYLHRLQNATLKKTL